MSKHLTGIHAGATAFHRLGAHSWQPSPLLPEGDEHTSDSPPATPPAGPDRPDGVTEEEWAALGDPGKSALVRERARATAAEQALAANKAKPTPRPPSKPAPKSSDQADFGEQIRAAVEAAVGPLLERDAAREASQAAEKIREAVITAASARFHDASDALVQVNLATLTDGEGRVDEAKVTSALDDLLSRKPHLGKAVDPRRHAAPGTPIGAGSGAHVPLDERVKEQLALMAQNR